MLTFVWFFLALSFLVLMHEFGHYIFAKAFHVYVYEFSIFMGPVLFQKQVGETKYSIRLLPIGGYCSMAGELDAQAEGQDVVEDLPKERTLSGINRFKQFLIAFAGPFVNIVLAFILMIIFFLGTGVQTNDGRIFVKEDGLFAEAGLKNGDKIDYLESIIIDSSTNEEIIKVSKTEINSYDDIVDTLNKSVDTSKLKDGDIQTVTIYSKDHENPIEVKRVLQNVKYETKEDKIILTNIEPKFGVTINSDKVGFGESIKLSFDANVMMGTAIFDAVGKLFTKEGFNNVSGIVGMYQAAETFGQAGIFYVIYFVAMISINLGILNLLPFPALDGGRILILLIESITRKDVPAKVENFINNLGFIFLMGLIIAVTIKDIFFSTALINLGSLLI